MQKAPSKFIFNIDRGGTFTDFYVQQVKDDTSILSNGDKSIKIVNQCCFKVPSVSSSGDGPIVGIRQFLEQKGLYKNQKSNTSNKIPIANIKAIKIGTTIATNALLERKGVKNIMILTQGFQDLLQIREQTRPNIFDLKCQKPSPLTSPQNCFTLNSRVYLCNLPKFTSQQIDKGQTKLQGSQQSPIYLKYPSQSELSQLLQKIIKVQPKSIGISLCNSYLAPQIQGYVQKYLRENLPKQLSQKINFQKGSKYVDLGYLKRTETASLDAYLNPLMKEYFQDIYGQFQVDSHCELQFFVMKSDGGFTSKEDADASKMLLSGPAGGLIGYSEIAPDMQKQFKIKVDDLLGLDMGGTSTDVSKVKNRQFQLKYFFAAQGIQICTPHLEIQTIAAGGGSELGYRNGMLTVGPESVGSNPGPVCYGIGQRLAVTDANLVLNRLQPSFFPKVFGKNKDSGPNRELSIKAFQHLAANINKHKKQGDKQKNIYELAEGYIQIANQLMAKSARKILTLGRPDALVVFGSAGGQHCCDIAEKIGVNHIIIHRYSGILSAYGLSKTSQMEEIKMYLGEQINSETFSLEQFHKKIRFSENEKKHISELKGFIKKQYVTIGYMGTSYTLKIPLSTNLFEQFERRHKDQNGFTLPGKKYKIQSYVESYIKKPEQYSQDTSQSEQQNPQTFLLGNGEVFMNGQFNKINKYKLSGMKHCQIDGPNIILSQTSTIFVKKGWHAKIINENIHLSRINTSQLIEEKQTEYSIEQLQKQDNNLQTDPIKLTIYSTRLMGIAEQMGKVLQKTSISTNIKERLDFSCGIFDWHGHLLANAPHLPVHLGSMETAVIQQLNRGIKPGDVILTNHPVAGGAHLPDLTVVTCFQIVKGINFYVASRGHHADIGGITPGSMPPFSKTIFEEGVAVQKFKLIQNGNFLQKQTRQLFKQSRKQDDNISDILAQISANQIGIKLLKMLIKQNGFPEFRRYVKLICLNAKQCVEELLINFSLSKQFDSVQSIISEEYMDDGTKILLKMTINRQTKTAIFDFTGTGYQVVGNTNAPKSITRSAVLYCLRCLIGQDIPLNSGCLIPIQIIIPENSILNPSKEAAVVGGNVETSQKLVDLIFKPFESIACSQGTMNNFLFGNDNYCYYETICGGSGAGDNFSGQTVQCHMTNTRITDLQHLQKFYPVVLTKFQKRKQSGGVGKFNGGEGVVRQFLFLQKMQISILSERRVFQAYGIKGGISGAVGRNIYINKNGTYKNMGGKNCFWIQPGQIIRIETPGGGGYGKLQNNE